MFLSTSTDRITPNIVLLVTLINGFILGFLTTGYLGESSMGIFSFQFWLFVEQFVVICFFSARYVNLTTEFLNKFFLSALIGFSVQWQSFGLWVAKYEPENTLIEPLVDPGFATFILGYAGFLLGKYCFSGNEVEEQTKISTAVE